MSRHIDAEKLFNTVGSITPKNAQQYEDIGNFMNIITETPTEDVKPIVYGKWQYERADSYTCSKCGHWYTELFDLEKCTANFCPKCGADMRKEQENDTD